MAPRLDGWDKELRSKGLRVIEVENGYATERSELDAHMAAHETSYAVLYDGDMGVTQRFEVRGVPAAFVVDRAGKIVWHGYPEDDLAGVRKAIDRALTK